jgi:hypothetical protein
MKITRQSTDTATQSHRFNAFFATEEEARLIWAMYNMALHGIDLEIPPFPSDKSGLEGHLSVGGRDLFKSLHAVDLSEYAARYTQLRPAGSGKWRGLCPIHREKTASFYIYANPWRWRCYGACAAGGDIVALARELKKAGVR